MPADWDPALAVPESSIVPLFGADPAWSPAREAKCQARGCRGCGGRIEPGSVLYCPGCQLSGFEQRLAAQRARYGVPAKTRRAYTTCETPGTGANKRASKRITPS